MDRGGLVQLFVLIVSAAWLLGFRGTNGCLGLKVRIATFGGWSQGLIAPDLFAELVSAVALRNTAEDQGKCSQRRNWPNSGPRPKYPDHPSLVILPNVAVSLFEQVLIGMQLVFKQSFT